MQQTKRTAFYFIWHLSSGMIIAYSIGLAFVLGFCVIFIMRHPCIGQTEIFSLMLLGFVLALLSFLIHRLIRGWKNAINNWRLTRTMSHWNFRRVKSDWSIVWRILLILVGIPNLWSPTILIVIPLLIASLLLLGLDYFWDRQLEEKPKRKHDET